MPIYEFECHACGSRFEELAPPETGSLPCPECGSERTRRLLSPQAPVRRLVRTGPRVRAEEAARRNREEARRQRLAEGRAKRAAGEPVPRRGRGKGAAG
jgi:putative FmdB family regulatory protein